ncbi:MAG: Cell shape defining protein RodZ [Parcubacteria group bacterium GW2011_GWA2_36_10]|nr:MAG: Cell shape defining protein RodZ [Parcubacteria group bacterium GW2011_GWA2_36_10]
MVNFQRKTISQGQTVNNRLKQSRQEQGLSLEQVSAATKIQIKYLEHLEVGDYQALPGEIYIRTWLKLYADFLALPSRELLSDYKKEKVVGDQFKDEELKKENKFAKYLGPHLVRKILLAAVVLLALSYLVWEINNIISPPKVEIFSPSADLKTGASSVDIEGKSEPEVQLFINNELVLLDEQGNFKTNVALSIGLNNLEINAKKKHSKTQTIYLNILREEVAGFIQTN